MADLDVPWNDQDSSARTIIVDYLSIPVRFPFAHVWQYQHPYRVGLRGERRRGYIQGAIRGRPHRPRRGVVQAVGATEPDAEIASEIRPVHDARTICEAWRSGTAAGHVTDVLNDVLRR